MIAIASLIATLAAGACPSGAVISCSISGCLRAYKECYYPGWGPCECYQWACPTGNSCDDGNPLTYRDTCNTNHQCAGQPVPFTVAFYDSMTKCSKVGGLAPSNIGSTIRVAKNEFEGLQLAIHANASYAYDVIVTPPTYSGSSLWTNVYREEFQYLSNPSGPDGGAGWWPDRLIPKYDDINDVNYVDVNGGLAFPYLLPAGENTVAYVEMHASPSLPAARYEGAVTIRWYEGSQGPYSSTWPLLVDVEPFALPSTSSLPSVYRRSPDTICAAHGIAYGSEACSSLLLKYSRFSLDHRISVDPAIWPDSAFVTRYQNYMNGTGPQPIGSASPRLWTAIPTTTAAYTNRANQADQLTNWMNLMRAAPVPSGMPNWLDRALLYWCDEPAAHSGGYCPGWPNSVVNAAGTAHPSGASWLRQAVTTNYGFAHDALGDAYSNSIDVITPNVIHVQAPGSSSFPAAELSVYSNPYLTPGTGKSLWWYQANDTAAYGNQGALNYNNYPQLGIDVHGVKNRAMPWLTFGMAPTRSGLGIRGELYWQTVSAYTAGGVVPPDSLFEQFGQNGDGNLMYPGVNRPLPSLRLKALRDGMEDYEYLQLIANTVPSGIDCARSIARTVFQHGRDVVAELRVQTLKDQRAFAASMIRNPSQACPLVSW